MSDEEPRLGRISEGYWVLENPEQRAVIKHRIIDLVRTAEDTGTVIFLDKTARPLGYLFRLVFPIIYPDKKVPKVKFINIGTEKLTRLAGWALDEQNKQAGKQGSLEALPGSRDMISRITTKADLEALYGKDNIAQLSHVLEIKRKPEKRLIVDETEYSGETRLLTERIVQVIDPLNQYLFFIFLDSKADKSPFETMVKSFLDKEGVIRASMPWSGESGLVRDAAEENWDVDDSFLVHRASGPRYLEYGGGLYITDRDESLKLRDELQMLSKEIKGERKG